MIVGGKRGKAGGCWGKGGWLRGGVGWIAIKKRVWHQQVPTGRLCYCSADISSRLARSPAVAPQGERGGGANTPKREHN